MGKVPRDSVTLREAMSEAHGRMSPVQNLKRVVEVAVAVSLMACFAEHDETQTRRTPDGGASETATGGPSLELASSSPSCVVNRELGDLGSLAGARVGIEMMAGGKSLFLGYPLQRDREARPDVLSLELYEGQGVLQNGIKAGSYEIKGDETQYATCGLCVLVLGDLDRQKAAVAQTFMAQSGTVTLTSVEGRLIGSLENVVFLAVAIKETTNESPIQPAGCTSRLSSATFDGDILAAPSPGMGM